MFSFYHKNGFLDLWYLSVNLSDTYQVHSDKISLVFYGFAENWRARKPKSAQTKRAKIMGVHYYRRLWSCLCVHQKQWCQLSLLSFIISALHFLIIFSYLPFFLHHRNQNSAPPSNEYAVPSIFLGIQNHMTASPPNLKTRSIQ